MQLSVLETWLPRTVQKAVEPLHQLPVLVRYFLTILLAVTAAVLHAVMGGYGAAYPLLFCYPVVFVAGLLFEGGSGLLAVLLLTIIWAVSFVHRSQLKDWVGLLLFAVTGAFMALALEAVHLALRALTARENDLQAASARLIHVADDAQERERRKDLLFRELGHRTRNDLTAVTALLRQRARIGPVDPSTALQAAADQVAVLARVHSRLSPDDDHLMVPLCDFLEGLVSDMDLARAAATPVRVRLGECAPLSLNTSDAAAVGLIINELVTNALKYAFPHDRAGEVDIALVAAGPHLVLIVEDNGVGMPPALRSGTSLGTRLVERLAGQLDGVFSRDFSPGRGTRCTVTIPAARFR